VRCRGEDGGGERGLVGCVEGDGIFGWVGDGVI